MVSTLLTLDEIPSEVIFNSAIFSEFDSTDFSISETPSIISFDLIENLAISSINLPSNGNNMESSNTFPNEIHLVFIFPIASVIVVISEVVKALSATTVSYIVIKLLKAFPNTVCSSFKAVTSVPSPLSLLTISLIIVSILLLYLFKLLTLVVNIVFSSDDNELSFIASFKSVVNNPNSELNTISASPILSLNSINSLSLEYSFLTFDTSIDIFSAVC